jgi:hypothetical protein
MAYSFYKKEQDLTIQDIQDPDFHNYFMEIERKVTQFGRTSRTYIERVVAAQGPAGFDIVLSQECVLLNSWQMLESKWKEPLLIYYPNPTLSIDNTYGILQGPWVKSEERNAALVFQQFLWEGKQQRSGLKYGFRPGNPNVDIESDLSDNLLLANYSSDFHVQKELASLVQAPSVDVANALLQLWVAKCSSMPIAGG